MDKENIDEMVNRFLSWRLPKTFSPDGGITFNRTVNGQERDPNSNWWPIGTNLLTADEARQMFEYVLKPKR